MHLFINYRKKDTEAAAKALREWLATEFRHDGPLTVFLDSESIGLGEKWPRRLRREVRRSDVVLALIGDQWLRVKDPDTDKPRLDDPEDWVRLELATAISARRWFRPARLVIPVLVNGATLPLAKDLPKNLQPLVQRTAAKVRINDTGIVIDEDTSRLVDTLRERLRGRGSSAGSLLRWLSLALLLVAAIIVALLVSRFGSVVVTITVEVRAASGATVAGDLIPGRSIWSGKATGVPPFDVKVDERQAKVSEDGTWSVELELPDTGAAKREVEVVATDASGRKAKVIRSVQVDARPPELQLDRPAGGYQLREGWAEIRGEVSEARAVVRAVSGGRTFEGRSDGRSFSVEVELPAGGTATYELVATDAVGNGSARVKVELRRGMASTTDIIETGIGLRMLPIAAQEFEMGSPEGETGRGKDELQHRVKITKPYWIGETEVTQGQWQKLMGTAPWKGKSNTLEGDDVAVSYVTWDEAKDFCAKLTEQERDAGRLPSGYRYGLPTEAEWELACRAGSKTAYCFGDDGSKLRDYAVFAEARSGTHAHRFKQRKPNAWGLFDMHGNVWEWCLDAADYSDGVVTLTYRDGVSDPYNASGSLRVFRGGSWLDSAQGCRSAIRSAGEPADLTVFLGFRPALAARSDVK